MIRKREREREKSNGQRVSLVWFVRIKWMFDVDCWRVENTERKQRGRNRERERDEEILLVKKPSQVVAG